MQTFAQKPRTTRQTTSTRSTKAIRTLEGQHHEASVPSHLQRTIEDQSEQRTGKTSTGELNAGMAGTASPHIGHHDFSHIPIHAKESRTIPTANARGKENEEEKAGLRDAVGHRIEPRLRSWFEQRLGEDLADVRIYRGAQADGATRKHAALAATVGRRIAINSAVGELNTGAGLLTLAHELIHTAQQKDASGPVSEYWDSAAEHQAHALAPSLLMPGSRPTIHRVARPSLMFLTAASGQQSQTSSGAITADLTSPIVVGRLVQFQVYLAPKLTYQPAATLAAPYPHFLWRVIDRNTNAKVAADWSADNRKAMSYPRVGNFRVECVYVDPSKGSTPAMTLDQDVVAEDPALAGQLSSDSDNSEAETELVDDLRSYVNDAATSTGLHGITPRFLACVLREEIANTDQWPWGLSGRNKRYRDTELSDVDSAIKKKASGATVPTKEIDHSVGVAQMKLSTAAMQQGLIPWIEQDPANKWSARNRIADNFSKLPTSDLVDLHTLLAWPKSNIKTAADHLARLKNRPSRYPAMVRTDFGTNKRACEIIATEYNIGASNSPEISAASSKHGQHIWDAMSLSLMKKFFTNS